MITPTLSILPVDQMGTAWPAGGPTPVATPGEGPEGAADRMRGRNERVMQNQGLVHQVARGFQGRGVALDDLIQFGNIGLIRAAEKYEPTRGTRFSTYAVYWIRQTIFKGIANTSRPVRVPLHARKEVASFRQTSKALATTLGREAWFEEVATEMAVAPARRQRLSDAVAADQAKFGVKPLEELAEGPDGYNVESILADLVTEEHRGQLSLAMERLTPEQRRVLILRYGLDGSPPVAIKAAADRIGCSWRAAQVLEQQAIRALKAFLRR